MPTARASFLGRPATEVAGYYQRTLRDCTESQRMPIANCQSLVVATAILPSKQEIIRGCSDIAGESSNILLRRRTLTVVLVGVLALVIRACSLASSADTEATFSR